MSFELLSFSLEFVSYVVIVVSTVFPIALGAYAVLSNRRYSLEIVRYRKRVWGIGYSESDIRYGRIMSVVVGSGLVVVGLILAAERLLGP